MFWVYMALLLVVVLGWAAWFDRRKKIRRVSAPDRPLTGDSSMMWRSSEVDNLTRPRNPDRED